MGVWLGKNAHSYSIQYTTNCEFPLAENHNGNTKSMLAPMIARLLAPRPGSQVREGRYRASTLGGLLCCQCLQPYASNTADQFATSVFAISGPRTDDHSVLLVWGRSVRRVRRASILAASTTITCTLKLRRTAAESNRTLAAKYHPDCNLPQPK
jgi:hypothetical protein